jgi:S1-C subfamily serine protease
VVQGADKIEVIFSDGTTVPAELVGADPDSDLAVIKVDVENNLLRPVQMADSELVKVGQLAIAIGNPYGLQGTMTVGIISAIGRTLPASQGFAVERSFSIPNIIQTDAPINPGNSGGVLVNDQGQVIGVTAAIESTSGANAGIGFVIPSSLVQKVVPELIQDGDYQHPYLGILGQPITPDVAKAMDLPESQRGALVIEVTPDGPADKAGVLGSDRQEVIDGQELRVGGDVIVAIEGQTVQDMEDLIAYLDGKTQVGQEITLTVLRDGKQTDIQVTLEARPTSQQASAPEQESQTQSNAWLGIMGAKITTDVAEAMGLDAETQGVLVQQVETGSPADAAGLRGSFKPVDINGQQVLIGGDIIVAMDGKQVDSLETLRNLIQDHKPGEKVILTILRDGETLQLKVTFGERPSQ